MSIVFSLILVVHGLRLSILEGERSHQLIGYGVAIPPFEPVLSVS